MLEKQKEIKETIELLGVDEEKEEKIEEKSAQTSTSNGTDKDAAKPVKSEFQETIKATSSSTSMPNMKVEVEEKPRREIMSVPTKDGQLTVNDFRKILISMKKVI